MTFLAGFAKLAPSWPIGRIFQPTENVMKTYQLNRHKAEYNSNWKLEAYATAFHETIQRKKAAQVAASCAASITEYNKAVRKVNSAGNAALEFWLEWSKLADTLENTPHILATREYEDNAQFSAQDLH